MRGTAGLGGRVNGLVYNDAATSKLWRSLELNHGWAVINHDDLPAIIEALQDGADPSAHPDRIIRDGSRLNSSLDFLWYLSCHWSPGVRDEELIRRAITLALEQGSDLHAAAYGFTGDTLLHGLVTSGNSGKARFLIEKGADVNALNNVGRTPLHHYSGSTGSEDLKAQAKTLFTLMRAGADITIRDKEGKYAPQVWSDYLHEQIANTPEFRREYGKELLTIYPYVKMCLSSSRCHWDKFDPLPLLRDALPERPEDSATVDYMRGVVAVKDTML